MSDTEPGGGWKMLRYDINSREFERRLKKRRIRKKYLNESYRNNHGKGGVVYSLGFYTSCNAYSAKPKFKGCTRLHLMRAIARRRILTIYGRYFD